MKAKFLEMKRIKDEEIIPLIIAPANIRQSIFKVLEGTARKESKQGREILAHIDQIEAWLAAEIESGKFRLTSFGEEIINEREKARKIQFLYSYYEKIGIHAIMNIVEQLTFKRLIRTTGASLKNRGTHDLLKIIRRDMAEDPDGTRYTYADDISKFYESIDQDVMMDCLRHYFKGRIILTLLERFVRLLKKGVSIGLRSSQHFGNLLLSLYLDHVLKSGEGFKLFYRYCDDKRLMAGTKSELWHGAHVIERQVELAKLTVKPGARIFPTSQGVDFLGYVARPTHVLIRKRNKQRTARKLKKIKSKTRRAEIIASFYSLCKHADAKNLFYKLTGIKMADYPKLKTLAELGIPSTPGLRADGTKNFPGRQVALQALIGSNFCIVDFQPGMSTQYSRQALRTAQEKGDTGAVEKKKYLVSARMVSPHRANLAQAGAVLKKGDMFKFFTGNPDMWAICESLKEAGELDKNVVTVEKESNGKYTEFRFK